MAGTLSDQVSNLGFVDTGSVAINEVITGDMSNGVPIGGITQIKGAHSTAKTVFLTHILKSAQSKGYYAILDDAENAYSVDFSRELGINPDTLIYNNSRCIEDSFDFLEKIVKKIRETDKNTPIIFGLDSLAVLPTRDELEAKDYEQSPITGALRAKITGGCLRKVNSLLRDQKVGLIIINQIRSKTGVMYGSPDTLASGGRSLEYYLSVDLELFSGGKDTKIKDEFDDVVGITGTVKNRKNKCGIPYKECGFELFFDRGLNRYYGAISALRRQKVVTVPSSGWLQVGEKKFQKGQFMDLVHDTTCKDFDIVRKKLGMSLTEPS